MGSGKNNYDSKKKEEGEEEAAVKENGLSSLTSCSRVRLAFFPFLSYCEKRKGKEKEPKTGENVTELRSQPDVTTPHPMKRLHGFPSRPKTKKEKQSGQRVPRFPFLDLEEEEKNN